MVNCTLELVIPEESLVMSIKITRRVYSEEIQREFRIMLDWVKKQKSELLFDLQEVIFNILRVITNSEFRERISAFRKAFNVPADFYIEGRIHEDDRYEAWLNSQGKGVPVDPWDKTIQKLCSENHLNPNKYGEFMLNYLFFGDVIPFGEFVTLENALSIYEPKYKARLVVKSSDYGDIPEGVYIRIYKDITINQIHEYIEKNKEIIWFLQEIIEPFPKTRNRKIPLFKRDLEVYLYHELGYKSTDIANAIDDNFIGKKNDGVELNKNESFFLDDSNIRKIASDINKAIQSSSDI